MRPNLLSPTDRSILLSYTQVPKKHVMSIIKSSFEPLNLQFLDTNSNLIEDPTDESIMSFEDGAVRTKKAIGKLAGFKTPAFWSRNFIVYVNIVSRFFGVKHPEIVSKLLTFHNEILKLSETYDLPKAVLNLAIQHHRNALQKGFSDLPAWTLPPALVDYHCRAYPKFTINTRTAGGNGDNDRGGRGEGSNNHPGVACRNFNTRGCDAAAAGCYRDHKCKNCGGPHRVSICKKKG